MTGSGFAQPLVLLGLNGILGILLASGDLVFEVNYNRYPTTLYHTSLGSTVGASVLSMVRVSTWSGVSSDLTSNLCPPSHVYFFRGIMVSFISAAATSVLLVIMTLQSLGLNDKNS